MKKIYGDILAILVFFCRRDIALIYDEIARLICEISNWDCSLDYLFDLKMSVLCLVFDRYGNWGFMIDIEKELDTESVRS